MQWVPKGKYKKIGRPPIGFEDTKGSSNSLVIEEEPPVMSSAVLDQENHMPRGTEPTNGNGKGLLSYKPSIQEQELNIPTEFKNTFFRPDIIKAPINIPTFSESTFPKESTKNYQKERLDEQFLTDEYGINKKDLLKGDIKKAESVFGGIEAQINIETARAKDLSTLINDKTEQISQIKGLLDNVDRNKLTSKESISEYNKNADQYNKLLKSLEPDFVESKKVSNRLEELEQQRQFAGKFLKRSQEAESGVGDLFEEFWKTLKYQPQQAIGGTMNIINQVLANTRLTGNPAMPITPAYNYDASQSKLKEIGDWLIKEGKLKEKELKPKSGFWGELGQGAASVAMMAPMAIAGTVGTGNPAVGFVAGFIPSFVLEGGTAYSDAKDYGLNDKDAAMYSLPIGIINGAIEQFTELGIGKEIARRIGKGVTQELAKKGLLIDIVEQFAKNGFKEGGEEIVQEITNLTAESIYKNAEDKPKIKEWIDRGGKSGLYGYILGGLMAGGSIAGQRFAEKFKIKPTEKGVTEQQIEDRFSPKEIINLQRATQNERIVEQGLREVPTDRFIPQQKEIIPNAERQTEDLITSPEQLRESEKSTSSFERFTGTKLSETKEEDIQDTYDLMKDIIDNEKNYDPEDIRLANDVIGEIQDFSKRKETEIPEQNVQSLTSEQKTEQNLPRQPQKLEAAQLPVSIKPQMTEEDFAKAKTPEITNFVKRSIGEDEFNKLVNNASTDESLIVQKTGNPIDLLARRIETAIYDKALDLIEGKKSQPIENTQTGIETPKPEQIIPEVKEKNTTEKQPYEDFTGELANEQQVTGVPLKIEPLDTKQTKFLRFDEKNNNAPSLPQYGTTEQALTELQQNTDFVPLDISGKSFSEIKPIIDKYREKYPNSMPPIDMYGEPSGERIITTEWGAYNISLGNEGIKKAEIYLPKEMVKESQSTPQEEDNNKTAAFNLFKKGKKNSEVLTALNIPRAEAKKVVEWRNEFEKQPKEKTVATKPTNIESQQNFAEIKSVNKEKGAGAPSKENTPQTPEGKKLYELSKEELYIRGSNVSTERKKGIIPSGTKVYHVAPPDYKRGQSIYSGRKFEEEFNTELPDKWSADISPSGNFNYKDYEDFDRVSVFDSFEEAYYFNWNTYNGKGRILEIKTKEPLDRNIEGYGYRDMEISSDWVKREVTRKSIIRDALYQGKEVPQKVLDEYPDLKPSQSPRTPKEGVQTSPISKPAEETTFAETKNVPIKNIKTDEGRFQNRADAFSEETASSIEKNFNPIDFKPITLWNDPKDGTDYVLAGHSRLEGMKRRGVKEIPSQYFEGTEDEAINYARIESNRKSTNEDLLADVKAYKRAKEQNYSKAKLLETFKKESKVKTLDNFSNLDENGEFLRAINSEAAKSFPYIERNSSWIGELRKTFPQLTDAHERELFDYFYRGKEKNLFIKKDDLFNKVEDRVSDITFKPEQNLALDKLESTGSRARSDTRDITRKVDLLKARNRELATLSKGAPETQKNIFQKEILTNTEKIQKLEYNIGEIINQQIDIFSQLENEIKNEVIDEDSATQIITTTDPEELQKLAADIESKAESDSKQIEGGSKAELDEVIKSSEEIIRKADEVIKPQKPSFLKPPKGSNAVIVKFKNGKQSKLPIKDIDIIEKDFSRVESLSYGSVDFNKTGGLKWDTFKEIKNIKPDDQTLRQDLDQIKLKELADELELKAEGDNEVELKEVIRKADELIQSGKIEQIINEGETYGIDEYAISEFDKRSETEVKQLEPIVKDIERKAASDNEVELNEAIVEASKIIREFAQTTEQSINKSTQAIQPVHPVPPVQPETRGDVGNEYVKEGTRIRKVFEKMDEGEQKKFLRIISNGFLEENPDIKFGNVPKITGELASALADITRQSILFDPRTANMRTAIHEVNHIVLSNPALVSQPRAERILKENGWDGGGDYRSPNQNKTLEDAYENFAKKNEEWYFKNKDAEPKTLTEKLIVWLKTLWNRLGGYLYSKGFYTQAGFFENLYTGRLKEMAVKDLGERLQEINPEVVLTQGNNKFRQRIEKQFPEMGQSLFQRLPEEKSKEKQEDLFKEQKKIADDVWEGSEQTLTSFTSEIKKRTPDLNYVKIIQLYKETRERNLTKLEKPIGLNKEEIKTFRDELDLGQLEAPKRRSVLRSLGDAKERKLNESALEIADEVIRERRPVDDAEHAGMVMKAKDLRDEYNSLTKDISTLIDKGDVISSTQLQKRRNTIFDQLDKLTLASDYAGTELGRALNIRKMRVKGLDYDLASIMQRAKATKGSKLTQEETQKIEELAQRYEQSEKELNELRADYDKVLAEKEKLLAQRITEREARKIKITDKAILSRDKILKERTDIKKQLATLGFRLNDVTGLTAEGSYLVGKLAVNYIKEGAVNLNEVVQKVLADLPDLTKRDVYGALNSRDPNRQQKLKDDAYKRIKQIKKQAELLEDIKNAEEGIFKDVKKRPPAPSEITALRKTLTSLRSEAYRSELDAKRLEKGLRTINELQDQLANQYRIIKKKQPIDTPEIEAIKEKIKDLRKTMNLEDNLIDLREQLRSGEFKIKEKVEPKPLPPEMERKIVELNILRKQIKNTIREMQPKTAKDIGIEVINTLRTAKASLDMSASLRQGMFVSARRPQLFAKTFGQSFQSFFSENTYEEIQHYIESNPNHYLRLKAGLELTDVNVAPNQKEEMFQSEFLERVPGLKIGIKASNRHMVTTLNLLRVGVFDEFLEKYPNATQEELKAWANYVNVATGRGGLGKFTQAANTLSLGLFSPRFAVSRFQTPYMLFKHWSEPRVRKEIAKDYVAFAGLGATVLALASLAGFAVSGDPDNPDFGKIKVGNTRIDIFAGLQQPMRLLLRTGKVATDRVGITKHKGKFDDPLEMLGRFSSYKAAPFVTIPHDLLTGRNMIGQKVDVDETLLNAIVPMVYEDIYDAYKEGGISRAAWTGLLNFYGMSVNTYKKRSNR